MPVKKLKKTSHKYTYKKKKGGSKKKKKFIKNKRPKKSKKFTKKKKGGVKRKHEIFINPCEKLEKQNQGEEGIVTTSCKGIEDPITLEEIEENKGICFQKQCYDYDSLINVLNEFPDSNQ